MEDRKTIKVIRLVLLGLVAAFLLFWGFAWSTFDVIGVGRYSIVLNLAAPKHLRAVELIGECRSPEYLWKGRDGAGIPFSSVTYGSAVPASGIIDKYGVIFKDKSCETASAEILQQAGVGLSMTCDNKEYLSVRVSVAEGDICRDVTVDFLDNG